MVNIIPIAITGDELRQRSERVARAAAFEPVDRVPISLCMVVRYWLPKVGGSFAEYFNDPEAMIRGQLYGTKWLLENVESDMGMPGVFVDFQNAQDASALGCETEVGEESGQIWVHEGWVKTEADLDRLRRLNPTNTGLLAKARVYAERMKEIGDRYVVRLKDGTELHPAANPVITSATMGPFTVACEVAGMADVSLALYERPEWAAELLAVVTDKIIEWMSFVERVQGMSSLWVADDYAGNLSLHQFRQFVLPCLLRIRRAFPGRHFGFHMCGKVDHLLRCLADELGINEFALFGYQVDKQLVQEVMGGRVLLGGNVNPMNIYAGTPESVFEESIAALRVFGRGNGGFILSDGANVPPDSPVENINAMMRASRAFAAERMK
jgi:uroporphyrinogen decarboxylase